MSYNIIACEMSKMYIGLNQPAEMLQESHVYNTR